MKCCIAGSRGITSTDIFLEAIKESGFNISHVISGGAKGVDTLAIFYADAYKLPKTVILADWDRHGRSAGYIRNKEMVDLADCVIAIWDGVSPGTLHTINLAKKRGIPLYIKLVS